MKNFHAICALPESELSALRLQLHQNPQLWNANPARLRPGSPHAGTSDIWVRAADETAFAKTGDYTGFTGEHESIWYPAYYALPALRKLIFDLARGVEAERIGDILLWRVRPGEQILPHRDASWHVDHYDKFNICLEANSECVFRWPEDNENLYESAGSVTRFINTTTHKVTNRGDTDYIVLVVCLRTHDYSRRFQAPQVAA